MKTISKKGATETPPTHSLQSYSMRNGIHTLLLGIFFLATLGGCLMWHFIVSLNEEDALARHNAARLTNYQKDIAKLQSWQRLIRAEEKRLRTTNAQVQARAVELAKEYRVTPNVMSVQVNRSSLVIEAPTLSSSTGLRMVVQGVPERLHKYFLALEEEFPTIAAMSTSVSRKQAEIEIETIYLVPAYAPF